MMRKSIKVSGLPPELRRQVEEVVFGSLARLPIESARGVHPAQRNIVLSMRGKTCYVRANTPACDPKSEYQVAQRDFWRDAKRSWALLDAIEREGWSEYALRWNLAPASTGNAGYNTYLKVMTYRHGLSRERSRPGCIFAPDLDFTPPVQGPPGKLTRAVQIPAPADTLAFRVHHRLTDFEGNWILVEMTPATPNPNRKPRLDDLRRACGSGPQSFLALQASGSSYVLENVRYSIPTDARFAIRLRVISREGVPGPTLVTDFMKEE